MVVFLTVFPSEPATTHLRGPDQKGHRPPAAFRPVSRSAVGSEAMWGRRRARRCPRLGSGAGGRQDAVLSSQSPCTLSAGARALRPVQALSRALTSCW